jgi:hypothetical protein
MTLLFFPAPTLSPPAGFSMIRFSNNQPRWTEDSEKIAKMLSSKEILGKAAASYCPIP